MTLSGDSSIRFHFSFYVFYFPFFFALPALTSAGLFASNNSCNSRTIEKNLSIEEGEKIVLDYQNSLPRWCTCTVMALFPAAADCMDTVSCGLICPFFPHKCTQFESETELLITK